MGANICILFDLSNQNPEIQKTKRDSKNKKGSFKAGSLSLFGLISLFFSNTPITDQLSKDNKKAVSFLS